MWYVLKFQMIARARAQGPFSDVCCINCSGSYGILNILAYVTESMKLESCFNRHMQDSINSSSDGDSVSVFSCLSLHVRSSF